MNIQQEGPEFYNEKGILTKKPKIAILSLKNSYGYGGVLSSLKVAHDFCQKYFDPTVFFLSFEPTISTSLRKLKFTSNVQSLNYFGMKCVEIGSRWAFWEPGHYKFNLKFWEKQLAEYDYFLAVSGTCICAHPLAILNKKFGILISTPYNDDRARRVNELSGIRYLVDRLANKKMQKIEQQILESANFIWALSNYSKKEFENIIQKHASKQELISQQKQPAKIVCCGHPIDCDSLPKLNIKEEKIIIAVGRFSDPRKNVDMLLRVFSKIHKSMPKTKLYVVGNAPEHHRTKQFSKLPFFQNIVFTGQVSASDLESLYQRASLMLLTSYQEGFGIVGLEALLHGVPIVATNCGGPADYAINDLTGYTVEINDDDEMACKAISILSNKEKHCLMSLNSQKFVVDNYSTSRVESFFKSGFIKIYPELKKLFDLIDTNKKTLIKTNSTQSKNISL
jgi:glycosyltransferase involved in cell wall biosynthesis